MNKSTLKALQYVKNTNGGATLGNFKEDWEPIGDKLLYDLTHPVLLVEFNAERKLVLTEAGEQALGGDNG